MVSKASASSRNSSRQPGRRIRCESDPVAAIVFCAPTSARHTVVGGRLIVDNGEVVTIDMGPVVRENNRNAGRLAAQFA